MLTVTSPQFNEIVDSPMSLLTLLGGQLAESAVYFMVLLSVNFGMQLPMKVRRSLSNLLPDCSP